MYGQRTTSGLTLALFIIISILGLAEASHAQVHSYAVPGATPASIQETVDEFRASIGRNNGTGGTFTHGRREISWDDVPDSLATPANLPRDYYNTLVPRGVVFDSVMGTFRVCMDDDSDPGGDPDADKILFDDLRQGYSAQFATFSGQRLFTPVGDIVTEISFRVPGTNTPATVQAFGIILIDVDSDTSTKVEILDQGGAVRETVKARAGKFSWIEVRVDRREFAIARIRVTNGNTLAGASDSATTDVVVFDDLIVGEPQPDRFEFTEGAKFTHEPAGESVALLIKRRGFATNAASVQIALAGTATASSDYVPPANLTVNFPAGVAEQSIHVQILNDSLREGLETVELILQNPSAGDALGPVSRATILIRDDERASPAFYAATEDNRLVRFSMDNLSAFASDVPIVGLDPDDPLIGLDFRPADGLLYGVDSRRLYRITPGPTSATAVAVGDPFTAIPGKGISLLEADIDARLDRFRIMAYEYSQRLDLETGRTVGGAADPPLTYAAGDGYEGTLPGVVAHASTNGVPGASTTTSYGIEWQTNSLVMFDAANPTTVRTVGPLDFPFDFTISMDIQSGTNFAFAVGGRAMLGLLPGYEQRLFLIDLMTGHAAAVGDIAPAAGRVLMAMAVAPNGVLRLAAPASINEGDTGTLRIERIGGSIGSIDATITIGATGGPSGTATPGVDFTPAVTTIRLTEGQTTATVPLVTREDALIEQTETIAVAMAVAPAYMAGAPLNAIVNLVDDDVPGDGGNGGGGGGGGGGGATPLTYALAEGATGPFFDLDILLANPNTVPAPVTLTFLKEDATTVTQEITLAPTSRMTVRVDEIAGLDATAVSTLATSTNGLPIVVERTMRWDASGYGAHTEKAVEGAATKWYFAEGSQGFFSTYLLLANPGTTTNTATVEYLREGESPVTRSYEIAPRARMTVDASGDQELVNRSFGMNVTFAQPGVAERSMYFGDDPLWKAGHESAGATAPATSWFLAEGATGPFFETFILLSNPQTTQADVTLTYLLTNGTPVVRTKTVPAAGRLTVNLEGEDPTMADAAVATQVISSVPIVVERAQYWPGAPHQWYEAHNSFGVDALGTSWGLAEGRTGGTAHYQTYILLANPGGTEANVTITFLRTNGSTVTKTFAVPAASRFNVATGADGPVPELADEEFAAVIASTQPIAVERAMYSDAGGVTWAAGTNATATRLP